MNSNKSKTEFLKLFGEVQKIKSLLQNQLAGEGT
jgi:hypothetical protein